MRMGASVLCFAAAGGKRMYNKVDEKFIAGLQAIVGKEHVFVDPDTLD